MLRDLWRKVITARTLLLLGVLHIVVYLLKEMVDNKILQVDVRMDSTKISPLTQNAPYVFTQQSCEINTSATSMEDFSSFPQTMKDFLYYKHCRYFPMLLDLPGKCGGAERSSEVFLLLVIKSRPGNHDRREILRKTWAKERLQNGVWIRRLFISGTMSSGFEKTRLDKVVELEHRQYKDILQWDFSDTFYNLTLKQTLFLEWMDRNCRNARFLFNGDDDVFANTDNMVKYLQSLKDNDGRKHLFVGSLLTTMGPIRNKRSRYFVPLQVYKSNVFPPYCSGGGFLLSGYTALVIYNMSRSISLIPIDDVYMGMCMLKAGLSPALHVGVMPWGIRFSSRLVDIYDPCFFKEVLVVHRFFSAEMYFMWHKIKDPNLKCFGNDK